MSFINVVTLSEAIEITAKNTENYKINTKIMPMLEAVGMKSAKDYFCPTNIPRKNKSFIDGYAVKSRDTRGATEYSPSTLTVVGEVIIGTVPDYELNDGEAVLIPPGGSMPKGSDAIVPALHTELFGTNMINITKSVNPGDNVLAIGADFREGDKIVSKGATITTGSLGYLAANGFNDIEVIKTPTIAFFTTGDELVDPPNKLVPGLIWDVSRYCSTALLDQNGFPVDLINQFPDDPEILSKELDQAMKEYDIVIISGAGTVHHQPFIENYINSLEDSNLLVKGILTNPGMHTVIAESNGALLFALPGNPTAVYALAIELIIPILQKMIGEAEPAKPAPKAKLTHNVYVDDGLRTIVTVALEKRDNEWYAIPLFGTRAATWLHRAGGYIVIPEGVEGFYEGDLVDIFYFD